MAGYDRRKYREDTDGGEAEPRPHRAQRLVDLMDGEIPREASRKKTPTRAQGGDIPVRKAGSEPTMGAIAPRKSLPVSPRPPRQPAPVPETVSVPADGCHVLSVTPEGEGETVAVVLSVPDAEGGKPSRVKLHLLVEQYADLQVQVGEITPEYADGLVEAGKLCAAIRRGMGLLKYGDQSARRLASKLIAKGVDRETAKAAAEYLSEKGYIREDDTARLRAEQGVRKGWGPRRIREDLWAQGFTPDATEDAMDSLSEVDFSENCAAVIRKKYGDVPEDRAARQKMIAALMRLGYDSDEIREAMRMVLRGNRR
ncbi:MAG: regulatory protein RecX [Clostridia bacterium]|nr:regulatory protein RecX [Clostridia bacterium]